MISFLNLILVLLYKQKRIEAIKTNSNSGYNFCILIKFQFEKK